MSPVQFKVLLNEIDYYNDIFIVCRLTCPEPYFLSEGLYATPEELENTREVTLHVITIGAFIEDAAKVSV